MRMRRKQAKHSHHRALREYREEPNKVTLLYKKKRSGECFFKKNKSV
jgi:hypothetical protein